MSPRERVARILFHRAGTGKGTSRQVADRWFNQIMEGEGKMPWGSVADEIIDSLLPGEGRSGRP